MGEGGLILVRRQLKLVWGESRYIRGNRHHVTSGLRGTHCQKGEEREAGKEKPSFLNNPDLQRKGNLLEQ